MTFLSREIEEIFGCGPPGEHKFIYASTGGATKPVERQVEAYRLGIRVFVRHRDTSCTM